MYLLDTNVCIRILTGRSERVVLRLKQHSPSMIKICSIVKAELFFGVRNSKQVSKNLALLERFCQPFESIAFDDHCAEYYGQIRADLHRLGRPIGPQDLFIAAIAKTHDFTLVTHNISEFSRVVGLKIEDWEER